MPHPSHAVTAGEGCGICGGPCRQPFHLPPIAANYPFLPPEVIAMTQPIADQPPAPDPKPHPKRGVTETTARQPCENTARRIEEYRR